MSFLECSNKVLYYNVWCLPRYELLSSLLFGQRQKDANEVMSLNTQIWIATSVGKAERKKFCHFQYLDRPMAKTLNPKDFPGLSRQNICSVSFMFSIHFSHFFHLFSYNWFYRFSVKANMLFMSYFWASGPNTCDVLWSWSRLLCNSLTFEL